MDNANQFREATRAKGATLSTRSMGAEGGAKVTQGPWGGSGNRHASAPMWTEGPKEIRLNAQQGLRCQRGCVGWKTVHDLNSLENNTDFTQSTEVARRGQRGESGQIGRLARRHRRANTMKDKRAASEDREARGAGWAAKGATAGSRGVMEVRVTRRIQ